MSMFHVSVMALIIFLTALSLVLRKCLLRVIIGKQTDWKKSNEMAHNKQQQSNLQNAIEALYNQNEDAMKGLIVSQDGMLCQVLMLINRGADDLSERRSINKSFLDSLTKVKEELPQALVWLKKNIDPDVCAIMLTDWKFSNSWLESKIDKVSAIKKRIEKLFAEFIKNRCIGLIATWVKLSYHGLLRLVTVALSYLDLTLDSILVFGIYLVLGSTLQDVGLFSSQVAFLLVSSILDSSHNSL